MSSVKTFNPKRIFNRKLLLLPLAVSALVFSGCGTEPSSSADGQAQFLQMGLPDSMTGGQVQMAVGAHSQGQPCAYIGVGNDDPFKNGYNMSKMLVSAVATWTCITDTLIHVSDIYEHDGVVHPTDNDPASGTYRSQDPTHYSITDDSGTQVSIRLYYGYDHSTPPVPGVADPGFYISWNTADSGDIEGKLIVDGLAINSDNRKTDDPTMMRLDFNYTGVQKQATMYLAFDAGNRWADGFRIEVTKDLTAPDGQVFLARGMIEMKQQFLPVAGISELPVLQMVSVSNALGRGATVANFEDVSLPLMLNPQTNNNLGDYLFSKKDQYYFRGDGSWEYIQKDISTAQYRGNRNTPVSGGTWLPFDPSLDLIVSGLGLDSAYFSGAMCGDINSSCVEMLNIVHQAEDGFDGQEKNQGADPMDWRSAALAEPINYLTSVYPNGSDWTGAFDFSFTPSGNQ
ncbi:MAG: hypothetical protein OEZ68_03670 [Gammaproteobacteria bacterium]|nr:hypothetical protein [Gammaproteobacteria bacterium]MDH5799883.1 hypothetical protein [Gammaproteobacteria bacterium]